MSLAVARFPSEQVILKQLSADSLIKNIPTLSDKGVLQAVAKFFADQPTTMPGIAMPGIDPGIQFEKRDVIEMSIPLILKDVAALQGKDSRTLGALALCLNKAMMKVTLA